MVTSVQLLGIARGFLAFVPHGLGYLIKALKKRVSNDKGLQIEAAG
jgi:hypothetical protein